LLIVDCGATPRRRKTQDKGLFRMYAHRWTMGRPDFEKLRVYQLSEKLANEIWEIVATWEYFPKDTLGKQIVRSADSIGANIAEDNGRYNSKDNQRFVATRAFPCVFRRRGVTRQDS